LARSVSDTFAGIRPADAPGFIVAQFGGAFAATAVVRWLVHDRGGQADENKAPIASVGAG
jgi:glycerol uptake facilitator-like aquaporin